MKNIKYYIALLLIVSCSSIFAQTDEEKLQLTANLNIPALEEFALNSALIEAENYNLALRYAELYGWPLTIEESDGSTASLFGIDENLQPIYASNLGLGSCNTISSPPLNMSGGLGNNVGSLNLNIEGQGLVAGIWEFYETTGALRVWPRTTHESFQFGGSSRVGTGYDTPSELPSLSGLPPGGHSTFVCGTMIGTNNLSVAGGIRRGIAGEASIMALTSEFQFSEMTAMALPPNNLIFANSSWGSETSINYYAKKFDTLLVNAPNLVNVISNGNINYNALAQSKNSISVGKCFGFDQFPYTNGSSADNGYLYNSGAISIPINDNALSTPSTITIIPNATLVSSNYLIHVRVNITHPNTGDLGLYLVGPGNCGTLELSTNNGGTGDNYLNTNFASNAIENITSAIAPFGGEVYYKPEGVNQGATGITFLTPSLSGIYASLPASSIGNCTIGGAWKLYVGDNATGNTGTLTSWSIAINPVFPTWDNRIKPDVVAQYIHCTGPDAVNDQHYNLDAGGTSFSAPAVTGGAMLLQQLYRDYNPQFMLSSTVKALLINTTKEAGIKGPEFKYGYGIVDLEKAAKTIINNGLTTSIVEGVLNNGSTYTAQVTAGSTQPILATLAWLDPATTQNSSATIQLMNDLDLRITSSSGTELPWGIDVNNPLGPAIKLDNIRDNVEKIQIENPIPGQVYTITVSHKGTLIGGSQSYSLIISGFNNCATVSPTSLTITNSVNPFDVSLQHANINIVASNVINSNGSATYVAGQEVLMSANFDALLGSKYDALIGDCINTGLNKTKQYHPIERSVKTFDDKKGNEAQEKTNNPKIYPNPNNGNFSLNPNGVGTGEFKILDCNGNFVSEGKIIDNMPINIQLNNVSSGIYYLLINSEKGIFTEKVNIQ